LDGIVRAMPPPAAAPVTFAQALRFGWKLGSVSFGGRALKHPLLKYKCGVIEVIAASAVLGLVAHSLH
jgi:hypothetical protein